MQKFTVYTESQATFTVWASDVETAIMKARIAAPEWCSFEGATARTN